MTTSRTTTGIPALAAERATHVRTFPLVVVGGSLTFSNPVPVGPSADVIVMGEDEELLPILVNRLRESPEREALLHNLAQRPLNPVRGYSGTTEEIPRTVEASEFRTLGPTGADSKLPSVGDHRTVVTMDAQGGSPHESIAAQSKAVLERLLGR